MVEVNAMVGGGGSVERPLQGRLAILCGASKGIGKATAKRIVRLGGSVCILARHQGPLDEAAEEIRGLIGREGQFVETIACDATEMERLSPPLKGFVQRHGTPDYLVNLVGFARPGYLEQISLEDYRESMEANYFGQLVPTLILLPQMKEAGRGRIAFVSSVLGYMGIMGFASYAPGKFAVVGLAEVLRNELKPHGIGISVLFPPDTETPGFEIENQTKPQEAAIMSENIDPLSAEEVADAFVDGLMRGQYFIFPRGSALVWRMNRFFPWVVRWVADRDLERVRRKLGKG
jgi:3-dehydrosphinganine reductase